MMTALEAEPLSDLPAGDDIRAALERIQAWPELSRSPQLSKFLGYIVNRTLDGEGAAIKAYAIAVDVFGRSEDFDPQADPIVRVQARRLRSLLEDYYRGPGSAERIKITLPTGRYQPEFVVLPPDFAPDTIEPVHAQAQAPAVPVHKEQRRFNPLMGLLIGLGGLGLVAMAAVVGPTLFSERPVPPDAGLREPYVMVSEFQDLTESTTQMRMVSGLSIELVTDLQLFEDLTVAYVDPESTPQGEFDYVLTGIARPVQDQIQYSAVLRDLNSENVVWSLVVERSAAEMRDPGALDSVSKSLALVLGSFRGPLHVAARQAALTGSNFEGRESVYACMVLYRLYRDTLDMSVGQRSLDCFARLRGDAATDHQVLAARGILVWDGVTDPQLDNTERATLAANLIEQAMQRNVTSSFVWEQRARHHRRTEQYAQARTDYASALQLNPANVDALAGFANMLALTGETDAAAALVADVMQGQSEPVPDWQLVAPAITAYRQGRLTEALDYAQALSRVDRGLGTTLAVMFATQIGSGEALNRYLPQLLEFGEFRREGIVPVLERRIEDNLLLADIRSGLMAAGVPAQALNGPF
jgi:TolB-like protein/Flp pilus assembly protein TadD